MKVENNNFYNLKIGQFFYEKNPNSNYKYHIVNIFKDNDLWLIVFKYYGKHKQWWHYELKELWNFNSWVEGGLYLLNKKDKNL